MAERRYSSTKSQCQKGKEKSLKESIYQRILTSRCQNINIDKYPKTSHLTSTSTTPPYQDRRYLAQAFTTRHQIELEKLEKVSREQKQSCRYQRPSRENIMIVFDGEQTGQLIMKQGNSARGGCHRLTQISQRNQYGKQNRLKEKRGEYGKMLAMNIHQRNQWWDTKRKQKLVQHSTRAQQLQLQECTFKPVINRPSSVRGYNAPAVATYEQLLRKRSEKQMKGLH